MAVANLARREVVRRQSSSDYLCGYSIRWRRVLARGSKKQQREQSRHKKLRVTFFWRERDLIPSGWPSAPQGTQGSE